MALILGTFAGELWYVERGLEFVLRKSVRWSRKHEQADENFIIRYITLISAFCFDSMGLFGAVSEGITGNPSILFTKAVLDLFSGLIFGAAMGICVSLIALPRWIIPVSLHFSAPFIMPFISDGMLQDFTSCGGVIFPVTACACAISRYSR